MAKFIARKTAPAKNDKNYYSKNNIFYASGYGMPNCTAYAWGRLLEITGKAYNRLCGNAEDWWNAAEKAGLERGQTPKLGAVICWRAGKTGVASDGAGHVAVVEEIKQNGDIVVSASAWKSTEFYLTTLTKASGYVYAASRPLQGFIYCGIEFESTNTSPSATPVKAGLKITLNNTPCFTSEGAKSSYDLKTGTYYLWDDQVRSGRIRITNSAKRVGVKGQITCWVNINDIGLKASGGSTSAAVKAGTKCKLVDAPVYNSESGNAIGKRSGIYYTWDNQVKNGRIRMTNHVNRVGVKGQVSFFADISSLKTI